MIISVLLSLFKNENPVYFDMAIKSIWDDQIRKPDEIILVEDGPLTDILINRINFWQDRIGECFIVITLEQNVGLAAALNEGIKYCNGDWIARMDTDDISLPNRFALQEQYLLAHPDIDLLGGAMAEFNEKDGVLAHRKMPCKYQDILKSFPKSSPFVHPSVFIKKELFDKGYLYDPVCRRAQDWDLWFRIAASGFKMENLPDEIIMFRKEDNLYERRKKSAKMEFQVSLRGTRLLFGSYSWMCIYPIVHYCFRMLPASWQLWFYNKLISKYWKKKIQNY